MRREKGMLASPRARQKQQRRRPNTWDSSIIETSSLNQHQRYDNASLGSRSVQSEKIKRTRTRPPSRSSKPTKKLLLKRHPEIGFGFSIRGGIEHGTGIFVSQINKYSDAFSQGLRVGDQILKANKKSFERVSHEDAVGFIQHNKSLRLVVLSLGVIPGSKVEYTHYQWIDCYGRPCSPFSMQMSADQSNDSNGIRLLEQDNDRKVNIVVGNNSRLGLLIRGGVEYGLGIFVAGIDEDSVADRSGIMVGEQIIDVNGIDFHQISHADAAHIIRTSKMMTLILKDVGKVPLARIVFDQTEWIDKRSIRSRNSNIGPNEQHSPRDQKRNNSVIQLGIAGTQLHHQSVTGPTAYQWIEEKSQHCLSEDEWTTLKYYIREYIHKAITVNGLVLSLLDLLDSKVKRSLIPEIRGIVRPVDLNTYDEMMLRVEVDEIKSQIEAEEPIVGVLEEENLATEPDILFDNTDAAEMTNLASNGTKSFNYKTLDEETYSSTPENMTEESFLSSPQKINVRQKQPIANILDEDITEMSEEIEEPLYSEVRKEAVQDLHFTPLKQYDDVKTTELNTFSNDGNLVESVANEDFADHDMSDGSAAEQNAIEDYTDYCGTNREMMDDTSSRHLSDARTSEMFTNDYVETTNFDPSANKNFADPDTNGVNEEADFENNKLGYAFHFINNERNDNPPNKDSFDGIETNYNSSHYSRQNGDVMSDEDDGSVISVSSLENDRNLVSPPESLKHVPSKPARLFRDLNGGALHHGANIVDIDFSTSEPIVKNTSEPIVENNFSSHRNSLDNNTPIISVEASTPFLQRKQKLEDQLAIGEYHNNAKAPISIKSYEQNDAPAMRRFSHENTSSSDKTNDHSSPTFDATPSLTHRFSNFSVNDIMRQNVLPTTRLDNDQDLFNASFDTTLSKNSAMQESGYINKVNSLNIQNQYEYQRQKSPSLESVPVTTFLEEPKNYGKPVMAKSPRTDFLPSLSNIDSLPRKVKTIKPENADEKRHFINIPKLRKTEHGNLLWGTTDEVDKTQNNDYSPDKIVSEEHGTENSVTGRYAEPYSIADIDLRSSPNNYDISTKSFRKQPTILRSSSNFATNPSEETKSSKSIAAKPSMLLLDTDFRATNKVLSSVKTSSHGQLVKSRIDTFKSKEPNGVRHIDKDSDEKVKVTHAKSKKGDTSNMSGRNVGVPKSSNNPGFLIDTREFELHREIFISEVQDISLHMIKVNDVIIGINNSLFKKGLQKGLANLMLKNAFNNTDGSEVILNLRS